MEEFPPNSDANKRPAAEKRVEQVTTGKVVQKKRGLGRQVKETFLAGDPISAFQYMVIDVALPMARDFVVEMGESWIRRTVLGESSRRSAATRPQAGPLGMVRYDQIARTQPAQRIISRAARTQHNFDEILLDSRPEAELVLERMNDVLDKYDVVTVADLYGMVGIDPAHTDGKWGWGSLDSAGVRRMRDGYLLDLPEPQPLS